MEKFTVRLVLTVIVLLASAIAWGQAGGPPTGISFEKDGNLEEALGMLYPVGWSSDGTFAFVRSWYVGEGCGCIGYDLIVKDLVSGEVLWRLRGDESVPLAEVWADDSDAIAEQFSAFGIELDRPGRFAQGNLLTHDGATFRFDTHGFSGEQAFQIPFSNEYRIYDVILGSSVAVTSPDLGFKEEIYSTGAVDKSSLISAGVVGVVVSPFEDRAAVIYATINLDSELSGVVSFMVIGADLH